MSHSGTIRTLLDRQPTSLCFRKLLTQPGIAALGPGDSNQISDMTRGTQLNGGGFRAGVFCPDQVNLFCDVQAQEQWRLDLMSKLSSPSLNNNHLVQGQVLFVVSDQDVYDSKVWDDPEALSGGVDGCLITGGAQSGAQNPLPAEDPDMPQVVAFQGGGGKTNVAITIVVQNG